VGIISSTGNRKFPRYSHEYAGDNTVPKIPVVIDNREKKKEI